MLYNVYMVCLVVGALYSLLSLLFNGVLDGLDFDFDLDFGDLSLPLKPFTIMIFVTVFGGVGLITMNLLTPWLTLVPSILSGILLAWFLHHLIYVRLRKYETETAREADAISKKADVVETILPGGYGRISYVMDGNTLSGAAKEYRPAGGIEKGRTVFIVDIKENVYYVCEDLEIFLQQNK